VELFTFEIPGVRKIASGKVREIFDLGDALLLVATDRISAFDCILPNGIPHKGEVLNMLSAFWFSRFDFRGKSPLHHAVESFPCRCRLTACSLPAGRWCEKRPNRCLWSASCAVTSPVWMEGIPVHAKHLRYRASGWSAAGGALPEPIFTPRPRRRADTTKTSRGTNAAGSWRRCRGANPHPSLRIYEEGRAYAAERGMIVADTKFEFGLIDGRVILIDECLTPDSSRFWPADQHTLGSSPPELRQAIRPRLPGESRLGQTPARPNPARMRVRRTSENTRAYQRLTGHAL
jgi:phosphoribosylaminoimidazole-succinocarboxamide synthase